MKKCLQRIWSWFTPAPINYPMTTTYEDNCFIAINRHRISIGLKPLQFCKVTYGVAFNHTEFMIASNKITHADFEYRANVLFREVKAQVVLENLGVGYKTIAQLITAWKNSPTHRVNLENNEITHMAICNLVNEYEVDYYTLILIKK